MSGIYLHIPFCKQACHYCNFHFSTSLRQRDQLVAALLREIALTPAGSACETIYFGGGTPSILTINELQLLFDALHQKFSIAGGAEITLEANPDDINPEQLKLWKEIGINRLSVGIQSFSDDELRWMNRAHSAADSLRCIDEINAAGFTNYSIDLIYGSPLLTDLAWEEHVRVVTEKRIPHISCYALTVEPKTALDKMVARHQQPGTDPEKQAIQFLQLMDWMQGEGYEHYEISNFARPGLRSLHNSSYWQGKSYVGLGPSAHSYDGKTRRWNIANNALYIQALQKNTVPFEEEVLTPIQQFNEYIMTSLRTIEGIDLEKARVLFGGQHSEKLRVKSGKYIETGQLVNMNSNLVLTREGKLFADGIAADLFF